MVPNTHTDTPKLIVAKPAPTKRKHCKRISFHKVRNFYLYHRTLTALNKDKLKI